MTDKNGVEVKVGDKVRTPDGDVVEIQGFLPKRRSLNMADCEVVPKHTPLGPEINKQPDGEIAFA